MSHKVKTGLILLFAFFLIAMAHPGESAGAQAITLEQAVSMALENNRELAAFRKRLDEARGDLTKASLIVPSNPVIGSFVDNRYNTRDNVVHNDYEINLSQEVQIFGQRGKGISVAKKNIEKVRADIETLEWEITSRVKGNFYEVLALKRVLELRDIIQRLFDKLLKAFRTKYEAGAATILEVNSIEIQHAKAKNDYLNARSKYLSSLSNVRLLLGLSSDYPLDITGELKYTKVQVELHELMETAQKHRPDLKALELEEERIKRKINLIKSQRIPNPILSGFVAREDGFNRIAGGAISIPLPIIDRKQAELQGARAQRDAARINIEGKVLQIRQELESAYQTFLSAQNGLGVYEGILSEVEDSLELNELTYLEGKVSFIEFLLLQNNLLEAKVSYLEALLGHYKALVELERASFTSIIK
ncbi:MAG: TolC family protein [Candidatus Brocadiales bacterium]